MIATHSLQRCLRVLPTLVILFCLQRTLATDAIDPTLQIPKPATTRCTFFLQLCSELVRVNTKATQPGGTWTVGIGWMAAGILSHRTRRASRWHQWPDQQCNPVGFKRRPLYGAAGDVGFAMPITFHLQLSNHISDGQSVRVVNDGRFWPTNMRFFRRDGSASQYSRDSREPGRLPADFSQEANRGLLRGHMGELPISTNKFLLVDAQSGATVYQGTLTLRNDVGYTYAPTPYQSVYQADFAASRRRARIEWSFPAWAGRCRRQSQISAMRSIGACAFRGNDVTRLEIVLSQRQWPKRALEQRRDRSARGAGFASRSHWTRNTKQWIGQ